MTPTLGVMINADQTQLLRDMSGLTKVAAAAEPAGLDAAPAASSFSQAMQGAVREVDAQTRAANDKMAEVDSGKSDDLVGAMMLSQEASLSFSMLMQVRNKVVGAVDDLIKMPI